jgi:quinolinate synthase
MTTIVQRIQELKKKRNAVLLVHNYQKDEVQEIADILGDSLELSRAAAKTTADVIVFCGVHFMAETASILCPEKTVLIPDPAAGCPMADMVTTDGLRALKAQHPGAVTVAYINTTAAVKAEVDICCTSGNAVNVVRSLKAKKIIFVPDKNLGQYVAAQVLETEFVFWPGYCPIHARIQAAHVLAARQAHPQAKVMVHPECSPDVTALADAVVSTSGMCRYARESGAREIIVGTEIAMLYRLRKENPGVAFYPVLEAASCENMKKNTLEKVLWSLEEMKYEVRVDAATRAAARHAIERMLAVQ